MSYWESDPLDLENLPPIVAKPSYDAYDNEMAKLYRQAAIGSGALGNIGGAGVDDGIIDMLLSTLKGTGKEIGRGLTTPRGVVGLLGILAGLANKQPSRGGGAPINVSPKQITRTIVPGKYGPIAQYAANGGLMQAYAQGGVVTGTQQRPMQMEDGGFVMTKKAVDGAGGPQGIAQLLPAAKLIRGPGTGTSDDIPATIEGNTPARVSNGEMYVPRAQVNRAGGAPALYALMNKLQRSA